MKRSYSRKPGTLQTPLSFVLIEPPGTSLGKFFSQNVQKRTNAYNKYSNFCSCQVTVGPKNTPIFVRVRSRRGQKILQFWFVSGHSGAKQYSNYKCFNFCSCQVTAGLIFFFKFQLARAGAPPLPIEADRRAGPAPALAN